MSDKSSFTFDLIFKIHKDSEKIVSIFSFSNVLVSCAKNAKNRLLVGGLHCITLQVSKCEETYRFLVK